VLLLDTVVAFANTALNVAFERVPNGLCSFLIFWLNIEPCSVTDDRFESGNIVVFNGILDLALKVVGEVCPGLGQELGLSSAQQPSRYAQCVYWVPWYNGHD
jgi:hypothetical protein